MQIRSKGIWTSRLQLTDDSFLDAPFPLPSIEEQNAIVKFLNYYDRRIKRYIRAKQQLIRLLNEHKQVIIHQAVTRGLVPNVRLKPSGVEWLGDIPKHWEVKPLKRWVKINTRSLSNNTDRDFIFDYIDIGSVGTGYQVHPPQRITFSNSPSRARRIVVESDTIISTVRTYLKAVLFISNLSFPTIVSTGFAVLSPNQDIIPEYLGYVIQDNNFVNRISANSIGVDYPAINQAKLSALKIAIPTLDEQQLIIDSIKIKVKDFDASIRRLTQEITFLKEYHTRLIADVVTGKLDVRAAAARLPDEPEELESAEEEEILMEGGNSDEVLGLIDEEEEA